MESRRGGEAPSPSQEGRGEAPLQSQPGRQLVSRVVWHRCQLICKGLRFAEVSNEFGFRCAETRAELEFFVFRKNFIMEGSRGSIPLWCRAGGGWRWDQRLPGLASPHIKPDSIFWQSTQLHSWVIFTTPEKPRPPNSLGIAVRGAHPARRASH